MPSHTPRDVRILEQICFVSPCPSDFVLLPDFLVDRVAKWKEHRAGGEDWGSSAEFVLNGV